MDKTLTKVGDLLRLSWKHANLVQQLIEASKSWRDAWVSILGINVSATTLFEELYSPIVGTDDGGGRQPVMTSRQQLNRTSKLKDVYTDLKTDLLDEVNMMDSRVIRPATDAKEYIQPIRKVIKKRDNKRLDWERYIDKVNNYQRKVKRTDRENASLVKAEEELARAAEVCSRDCFSKCIANEPIRSSELQTKLFEKHFLL